MKIVQVLTTLSFGDAVSNHAIAIKKLLDMNGYKTHIYCENLDPRLEGQPGIYTINSLRKLGKKDVMIYHLSTGSELNRRIRNFVCHKYLIYHNITPSHFFSPYSGIASRLCKRGRDEVLMLKDTFEGGMSESQYNISELRGMGYQIPLTYCPILIPFEDYSRTPNKEIIDRYSRHSDSYDGYKNIVFVGRIAPNKKQEDLIALLYAYKSIYKNENIRLILVGSDKGMETYRLRLEEYADSLNLEDVVITGQVSFDSILAYYQIADAFVCMSEHEGFCVPLVEAMYFHKPILAFSGSAIPDTLASSGIVLETKDMARAAFYLHEIINDDELASKIVSNQDIRLQEFSYDKVSEMFMEQFVEFLNSLKE